MLDYATALSTVAQVAQLETKLQASIRRQETLTMELEHCKALQGEPGQDAGVGEKSTLRVLQADNAALTGQVQELQEALHTATKQAQQMRMEVR